MSTFKDILYKKEENETWTEWNNRLPTDDDKRDYIGETIYANIYDENKEKAGKITGMLLEMDVEYLIPLLESDELLDEKIKEAYEILREGEEYKISEEEEMFEEDIYAKEREGFFYNYKLQKYCEVALWEEYDAEVQADALMETVLDKKYGGWGWGIKEEEAYKEEKSRAEKEEKEKVLDKEVEYLEARRENHQVAWTSEIVPCVFCSKDTAKVKRDCGIDICNDCFEVKKTSDVGCLLPLSHRVCWPRGELVDEEECEQCGKTEKDCITKGMMFDTGCLSIYALDNRLLCPDCIPSFDNDNDDDEVQEVLYPVKTITVAEMIAALSVLPPDAKLVMTESGFYSKSDFAEIMLPILYTVKNDGFPTDLPTGTEVYIIGHSHQSY